MKKALVIALIGVAAHAQQAPPPPSDQTFFSETIEVRVINVDVVVTGKDGKPVTGLTKNDFDVYENGQKRELTNFTEFRGNPGTAGVVTSATAPAPGGLKPAPTEAAVAPDTRTRRIVLFLDSSAMHPFNQKRILEPLRNFLRTSVRPSDQVMLVQWKPGLDVKLPFTNDLAAAQKAIDAVANSTSNGTALMFDKEIIEREISLESNEGRLLATRAGYVQELPPIRTALYAAHVYAAKMALQTHERVAALKSVIASMRGIDGRKAIVFVTETFSSQPGLPVFAYLDQIKDKFADGKTLNYQMESHQHDDPTMAKDIADLANSCGVTLYPISASGLGGDFDTLNAAHNNGEYAAPARVVSMERGDAEQQALREMAALTGGQALTTSNNFQLAFDTISSDLSTYYSLGYRAEGERSNSVHTIDVKLRKPQRGITVRARQSFVEKTLTAEMNDAVAANLFYPVSHNDLNVTMSAGAPTPAPDDHVVLPLTIKVPTSGLTLIPQGTDLVGQFSSYAAFVRKDGKVSEITRNQHQLRFPAESLKRRKEIIVKYDVTLDTRTEGVSVGVMDDASHATGFAMVKLAPAQAAGTQ